MLMWIVTSILHPIELGKFLEMMGRILQTKTYDGKKD